MRAKIVFPVILVLVFGLMPSVSASFFDIITGRTTDTATDEGKPDLIITDVAVPDYIMPNQTFSLTATVKNIGAANKSDGYATVAMNTAITSPRCAHGSIWSSLAPGESFSKIMGFGCFELERYNYGLPEGTYEITFVVDYDNAFNESDETNNEFKKTVVVRKKEPPQPAIPFKAEKVKCIFTGSDSAQKCYTDDGRFGCSGAGTCIAEVSGSEGTKLAWKSSCGGEAYTVIEGVEGDYAEFKCEPIAPTELTTATPAPEIAKEQVKCVFANSNSLQKCYAEEGKFSCSGTGSCVAEVFGTKGTKIAWKTSCVSEACCAGEAISIIDGNDEYAEFKCPAAVPSISKTTVPAVPEPIISAPTSTNEQVRCTFANSKSRQKCYTDDGRFGCSVDEPVAPKEPEESEEYKAFVAGLSEEMRFRLSSPMKMAPQPQSCIVNVSGRLGEKLTWKSSCGSYAYTVIDGSEENAVFQCLYSSNVSEEQISGKGFRYAGWQCYASAAYAGTEKMAEDTAKGIIEQRPCQSYEMWYKYATEDCANVCETQNMDYPDDGLPCGCRENTETGIIQCGVENIYFAGECYVEYGKEGNVFVSPEEANYTECIVNNDCIKKMCGEGKRYGECLEEIGYKYICVEGRCAARESRPMQDLNVLIYIHKDDCPECEGMGEAVDRVAMNLGIGVKKMAEPKQGVSMAPSIIYLQMGGAPLLVYSRQDANGEIQQCSRHGKADYDEILNWVKTCKGTPLGEVPAPAKQTGPMLICKDSCPLDNKCYPFGIRKQGRYCSDEGAFRQQLESDESCDNNFECQSNVCVSGKCISSGLLENIISWFKKLFGGEEAKKEIAKSVDCGASSECMENAFKVCKPAKISQGGSASEIVGLEDKKCVLKITAGAESMTCKIGNYALGTKNIGPIEQYCSGALAYNLAAATKITRAGEAAPVPETQSSTETQPQQTKQENIQEPVPATPVSSKLKEQVRCKFIDPNLVQRCYADFGKLGCQDIKRKCYTADEKFGCSWEGGITSEPVDGKGFMYTPDCIAEVYGEQGTKLAWKSSCGGEAYTVIDRNNEDATFACTPSGSQIKGFLHAYWKCGNGAEEKSIDGVDLTTCKSSEIWKEYVAEYCKNQGGIKDFSVSGECSIDIQKEGIFIST